MPKPGKAVGSPQQPTNDNKTQTSVKANVLSASVFTHWDSYRSTFKYADISTSSFSETLHVRSYGPFRKLPVFVFMRSASETFDSATPCSSLPKYLHWRLKTELTKKCMTDEMRGSKSCWTGQRWMLKCVPQGQPCRTDAQSWDVLVTDTKPLICNVSLGRK